MKIVFKGKSISPHSSLRIALLICLILQTSCIKRAINKTWPPLPDEEIILGSIQRSRTQLETLPRVDFLATISVKELQDTLPELIINQIPHINEVDIRTSNQQIIFSLKFENQFSRDVFLAGEAKVHGAFWTNDEKELVIQPFFKSIKLSKAKVKRANLPKEIVTFVNNQIINPFLENINGQIAEQKVTLDFSFAETIEPSDLLSNVPELVEFEGNPIKFKVSMERVAPLVDNTGIYFLGKLSENEAKIKYLSTFQTMNLGNSNVDQSFNEFKTLFFSKGSKSLGDLNDRLGKTSIHISKAYIEGLFNDTLSAIDYNALFQLEEHRADIEPDLIEADIAPNLNCGNIIDKNCDPGTDCRQTRNCNPTWNCPSCRWYQVDCHARKAACELDKVRYRAQCEIEKKVAHDLCEAQKAVEIAACEAEKLARFAGCELNQTWLDAWSGANFAWLEGTVNISSLEARFGVRNFAFSNELSTVLVNTHLSASTQFRCNLHLTPLDAGHLFCQMPWSGNISFNVDIAERSDQFMGNLSVSPRGENLNLSLSTNPISFDLVTSTPPVLALLTQNPDFYIKCAPAAVLGLVGVAFDYVFKLDLIKDTFPFELPSQNFDFSITPMDMLVFEKEIKLLPQWNEKIVGFETELQK